MDLESLVQMARGLEQDNSLNMGFDTTWESCEQILRETLDHNVTPLIKTEFDTVELPHFFNQLPVEPLEAEQQLPEIKEEDDSSSSMMDVDQDSDEQFAGSFYDLSDDQIANMNFKELSRLMRDANLSEQAINDVKALRRRLKNRHSARICSNKKRERCVELGETNRQLYTDLANLKDRNQQLEVELARAKQNADVLRQLIYKSGILHSLDQATRSSLGL